MRTMSSSTCKFVICALLLLISATARADTPATRPSQFQIGIVAGKSIDALSAFAKLTGVDLPPNISAAGIEQQFAFIGKDGIATDLPIGLAVIGSAEGKADSEKMIAFVIPVKKNAATIESLKTAGAKPLADHADTVILDGTGLRRTDDYLIISTNPDIVGAVDVGAIGDAVKDGDALARVSFDLKSARQNMAEQYKQWRSLLMGNKEQAGKLALTLKKLDSLDRLEIRLENGEKGARLAISVAPLKIPQPTAVNKAGMPPGVLLRYDLGAPIPDLYPESKDSFAEMGNTIKAQIGNEKKRTPESDKQVDAFVSHVSTLLLEPSATSIGVEMVSGDLIIYIAQHWSKKIDADNELQQLIAAANALGKADATKDEALVQSYQYDGVRVLRVVFKQDAKPFGYLDMVQKGDEVYATFSTNQYRYIHKLMAAKDEGPISAVVSASLDLEKLVKVMGDGGFPPPGLLPADSRAKLVELLAGQKVLLSSRAEGDTATLEITVGKGLIQNAPKIADLFNMSPAAAPNTDKAGGDAK